MHDFLLFFGVLAAFYVLCWIFRRGWGSHVLGLILGRTSPRVTDFEQVDRMSPEEWLALSYDHRIESVRLFLQREYPQHYPRYVWPVFVLVEEATEAILREWQADWASQNKPAPPAVIGAAMLVAVLEVGEKGRREGYASECLRALDVWRRHMEKRSRRRRYE